jgi:hypothetical protein
MLLKPIEADAWKKLEARWSLGFEQLSVQENCL